MSSPLNFKYLDDLIRSGCDRIVLESDIALEDGEESEYIDGIELVSNDIVIDGNGHSIDARGKARIFLCSGEGITIKDITLKNGFSQKNGGAICSSGRVSLINSRFIENTASWGGAVSCEAGEMEISSSTLTNNSASNGGAIYSKASRLTVENTCLKNNSALNIGGATYIEGGETAMEKSALNSNSAGYFGGAIATSIGNVNLVDCELSKNRSPECIIFNNDFLEIRATQLLENESKHAILNYATAQNLSIFYGRFKDNTIERSVICHSAKFCTIKRTAFEANLSAPDSINIENAGSMTLISPEIHDEGKTILNESYILIRNSPSWLEDMIFGDGIVESDADIIPDEESLDFGHLDEMIHGCDGGEVVLEADITFENYERDFYEGGIELDVDGITINGNGKTIDGRNLSRIFTISADDITLKNITFKNGGSHRNYANPPNGSGGALRINHVDGLRIEGCSFHDNSSDENGGAIDNKGQLTMRGCALVGNIATKSGGAISNEGTLAMSDCTLKENTGDNGGAISNTQGELEIEESTLTKNEAERFGGAVHNSRGVLRIEKSEITENKAFWFGSGAIYDYLEKSSTVNDCMIRDNEPDCLGDWMG